MESIWIEREDGQELVGKNADINNKRYLSDLEAAAYVGLSPTTFRLWAKRIGCRRKVGEGKRCHVVNIRSLIDDAIMNSEG